MEVLRHPVSFDHAQLPDDFSFGDRISAVPDSLQGLLFHVVVSRIGGGIHPVGCECESLAVGAKVNTAGLNTPRWRRPCSGGCKVAIYGSHDMDHVYQ